MGRKRYGRRRSGGMGGFGMNSILKGALFGIGASMILPRVIGIDPKLAGAIGGFFGGHSLISAGVGYIAPSLLSGVSSGGDDFNY